MTTKTIYIITPAEGMILTNGKRTKGKVMTTDPEEAAKWTEIPIPEETPSNDADIPAEDISIEEEQEDAE